jgi:hypothetical protein
MKRTPEEEQLPPPKKTKRILKKWGVWAGGIAATVGGAILASPEFGATIVGAVSDKIDPASVGGTLAVMGIQQAILAARRALLGLSEPKV